ncbi:hypothetical protein AB0K21_22490 [Streptosporangium sp. NPDC049248]|uniref:hypothetical protein n=1 Tax=Streptosporangium sp. NPDC049248 TaxID=3155651 RepID=UPI0034174D80
MPSHRRAHARGRGDGVDAVVCALQQFLRAADPLRQQPLQRGGAGRRAEVAGQDIYAISAPLAVEAVDRILILTGRTRTAGVASAGAVFDAPDFLRALSSQLSLHVPLDTRG